MSGPCVAAIDVAPCIHTGGVRPIKCSEEMCHTAAEISSQVCVFMHHNRCAAHAALLS